MRIVLVCFSPSDKLGEMVAKVFENLNRSHDHSVEIMKQKMEAIVNFRKYYDDLEDDLWWSLNGDRHEDAVSPKKTQVLEGKKPNFAPVNRVRDTCYFAIN